MSYTETGRSHALLMALAELGGGPARIIEVGGIRNASEPARYSDGWSTLTFLEYVAEHGGGVTMIEPSPRMDVVEQVCGHLGGLNVVRRRAEDVTDYYCDLLYLDGPNDPGPHLHAVQNTTAKVLAFDDCVRADFGPKAHTAIPWALENGYKIIGGLGRVVIMVAE